MLVRHGISAWWDGYEIGLGDPIRDKITEGLLNAEYGVLILSEDFYSAGKRWTKDELAALWPTVDRNKLLPILHGIDAKRLGELDPMMAGRRGIESEDDPGAVARAIAKVVMGPTEKDTKGRRVYRNKTIRLSDISFDENKNRITNAVFSGCTLVGPSVLINVADPPENLARGVRFVDTPAARDFGHKFVEVPPIPYGRAWAGVIGLANVIFERCYFKELGFVVTTEEKAEILDELARTSGSAQWPVHRNPFHFDLGNGRGGPA